MLRNRREIDPALTWDLTQIYENDAAWEEAFRTATATWSSPTYGRTSSCSHNKNLQAYGTS